MAREISFKVFTFDELSPEAQEVAIEGHRNSLYEDNDILYWIVDNDYLLEPPHKDLVRKFGKNFYEKLNKNNKYKDTPLVENLHSNKIYFDLDARYKHLDFTESIHVRNEDYFMRYLGIPKNMVNKIHFYFYTESGRYGDTQISFEPSDGDYESWTPYIEKRLELAQEKFNDYRDMIWDRLKDSYEYYFTDESIREEILANEYEFKQDGTRY